MSDLARCEIAAQLRRVRERAPLVHVICGTASQPLVADGLLAAGARPMMTSTRAEAPTLVTTADALLVNLGMLTAEAAAALPPTVAAARGAPLPWVLDPAAVGVAPVRTPLARTLLGAGPAVVRGNASEIHTLAGEGEGGRGPDATTSVGSSRSAAHEIARTGTVVAVSGPADLVTDGVRDLRLLGGTPLLTRVSGTGCLLGGLVAAGVAVGEPLVAAVAATALLVRAGERAAEVTDRPGSFRAALLDALDELLPEEVAEDVRLR